MPRKPFSVNQLSGIKKADSTEKSDTKSFQEHFSMFQLGYQDAAEFKWNSLPLDKEMSILLVLLKGRKIW